MSENNIMPQSIPPGELRRMFGANLRILCNQYPSVSKLCRDLGINRTQFNRYLSGESFPRPDVLYRICQFFDMDARILLEPIETLSSGYGILNHPVIKDFVGTGTDEVPQDVLPDGFFRFTRRSFTDDALIVAGLVYVFRKDGYTFLRGFEVKDLLRQQGMSVDVPNREFRGIILPQEDGVAAVVSHRNTINYLARVGGFQNNFWCGYATRPVRESVIGCRAARLVYEHLGRDTSLVLAAARSSGFVSVDDLPPYHRKLLNPDQPFS